MKRRLFGVFTLVIAFTMTRGVAAFVAYDPDGGDGTYAVNETDIVIEFASTKASADVLAELRLVDETDTVWPWQELIALNDIGGRASRFQGVLATPLDKTLSYTLEFRDQTIALDLDDTAPLISYTNKVRNDESQYDERTDTFYVTLQRQNLWQRLFQTKAAFQLGDYLRINVVDDRDGNLTDQLVVRNLPDPYRAGDYQTTLSITDSWDNERVVEFHFVVTPDGSNSVILANILLVLGAVVPIGDATYFIIRKGRVQ